MHCSLETASLVSYSPRLLAKVCAGVPQITPQMNSPTRRACRCSSSPWECCRRACWCSSSLGVRDAAAACGRMAECAEQPRRVPRLQRQPSRAETAQHGVALAFSGGVAGALAKTVVAPLERIKLLNQAGQSAGAFSTLYKVVHNEGWRALWRGNGVNVIRMIPNKGVLLSCSDIYKDNIRSLQISHFWTGAISGGLAGGKATKGFPGPGQPGPGRGGGPWAGQSPIRSNGRSLAQG